MERKKRKTYHRSLFFHGHHNTIFSLFASSPQKYCDRDLDSYYIMYIFSHHRNIVWAFQPQKYQSAIWEKSPNREKKFIAEKWRSTVEYIHFLQGNVKTCTLALDTCYIFGILNIHNKHTSSSSGRSGISFPNGPFLGMILSPLPNTASTRSARVFSYNSINSQPSLYSWDVFYKNICMRWN